jgi:hypothetical protein
MPINAKLTALPRPSTNLFAALTTKHSPMKKLSDANKSWILTQVSVLEIDILF